MEQITDEERRRTAGLVAEGAPPWKLHQEINRSRHAIRRAVLALYRPAKREPYRSPLRLSLAEREEILLGHSAQSSWPRPPARSRRRQEPTIVAFLACRAIQSSEKITPADQRGYARSPVTGLPECLPDARPSVGDPVLSVSGQLTPCQRRANHQDPVTTYHQTGGEPGAIAPSGRTTWR